MTLSQRLRAAAEAPRLADWVKLTVWPEWVVVCWRDNEDLTAHGSDARLRVQKVPKPGPTRWSYSLGEGPRDGVHPTREAAIRAGLLALAEREEARG